MPTLLIIHHTPSPFLQEMFESVVEGAAAANREMQADSPGDGVEVVRRAALAVTTSDVLAADGYLLGTPANLGYMSGALKHAFDTFYYPCLDSTRTRPFGYYVHGNQGTEGAERGIEAITTGLGWAQAAAPVIVSGAPSKDDRERCWELGATVTAQLPS